MEYIILWYLCFVYWIFINCSVVTSFFSSSFLDTLIDRIWCLNEKIYDRKLARSYLAETKYHYSNEMVTGKREFAFLRTGAVKHSRLPPRSRQVIKALLNWFLFPVELFYLTKNRQNAGTNNEWGLLDRNSLFVQSPSLPFPISSCSSFILFLSLSPSPLPFSPILLLQSSRRKRRRQRRRTVETQIISSFRVPDTPVQRRNETEGGEPFFQRLF